MQTKTSVKLVAVVTFVLASASVVDARQSLMAARELYASAEYNDALTMLDGLAIRDQSQDDRSAIELYRTLCLLAVGRKADADRALETLVSHDPLYHPAAEEIPPRMLSAFTDTRKRMLPSILQRKYLESKAAFDREDFDDAVDGFKEVLDGLADPDMTAVTSQPPLSDLRTLALGFHDLSLKAAEPPPPPPAPEPAAPPVPQAPRLYDMGDPAVVPPVTILQRVPPFRGRVFAAGMGILEIIIDDTGAVESAKMRVSLNGTYDKLVLSAAKTWQYQPATLNGVPVRFRKMVQVNLVPTP
ncbi:MAG: energy transducer TonB [Vicinamibacterales bacterium]